MYILTITAVYRMVTIIAMKMGGGLFLKFSDKWKKWISVWEILPLLSIVAINCFIYWGSSILTASRYHFDFTFGFDRAVPLIPEFVWIYILAFPFWVINYILAAKRGKKIFYRFVATDIMVHISCFLIFMLIPTTNIRPEITGNTIAEQVLLFVYKIDGGGAPSNLLPSIHCYVSWLCYRGLKNAKEIPVWYQRFSFIFALLVMISTQVLKQHYIIDAIAGILLVEVAWRFFKKESHYKKIMDFFEYWNRKIWKEKIGDV